MVMCLFFFFFIKLTSTCVLLINLLINKYLVLFIFKILLTIGWLCYFLGYFCTFKKILWLKHPEHEWGRI